MFSIVYVFPSCVPILPTNLIPNLARVSFLATPSLRVPFSTLLSLLTNSVSRHVKFVETVFPFVSPSTSTTPVIDTNSTLLASLFTSSYFSASPSSFELPSSSPSILPSSLERLSPCPISRQPASLISPTLFQRSSQSVGLLGSTPSPPSPRHPLDPLPIPSPPLNLHPMQTRSKNVITKPNSRYDLTTILPPLPEPSIVA